jgi:hypothetical protein
MMAVARLLSHINRIILRHEMWHSVQELKFSVGILSVARTMFFVLFFFFVWRRTISHRQPGRFRHRSGEITLG